MCALCSCVCCVVVLSVQMMEAAKEEDENMLQADCQDDNDNKVNTLSACLFIISPLDSDAAIDVIPDDVSFVSVSLPVAQLL